MHRREKPTRTRTRKNRRFFPVPLILALLGIWIPLEAPADDVPLYFTAIHCDPQHASVANWAQLVDLVAAADLREHKLTIQFNPQWAPVLQADSTRGDAIVEWVAKGHEIGGHHHVEDHPGGWDGYSNDPNAQTSTRPPFYQGDMEAWLTDLLAMLPAEVDVRTVSSKDYDFPTAISYQTGGSDSSPQPSDADSVPTAKIMNGLVVWNLKHAALIAGGVWNTEGMKTAFEGTAADQVFGVAFHPQDYDGSAGSDIHQWFDFLAAQDSTQSRGRTAGQILDAHLASLTTALPGLSGAGSGLLFAVLAAAGSWLGRSFGGRRPSPWPSSSPRARAER